MQTHASHLLFSVRTDNLPFYKDLMSFLGWSVLYEAEDILGVSDGSGLSLWFGAAAKDAPNDYDGPGLNHLGIGTSTQADVDATVAYLAERGVAPLFETPRHRPEFAGGADDTYYQMMFETPDRLLLEVVYIGPKAA